jgi:chromosome segregation ATPase
MVRQAKQPDEAEADLERTAELPMLDVASYEARLASGDQDRESSEPEALQTRPEESRPQPAAGPPPADMLRDIEAWIAAQNERVRADERALAEVQAARIDAQARADNLELTLEVTREALQTALGRANDGERAALDKSTAAQAAESRTAELRTELEQVRRQLAAADERIAAVTAELARRSESLAASARQQEEMQRRQSELGRALDERSNQMAQLDVEMVSLRAYIADADRELAQRTERIVAVQEANATEQATTNYLARERDALAMRFATLCENVQSNEWKRGVWEAMWHQLDTDLTDARTQLARSEAGRADQAATIDKVNAELTARDAIIARLETDRRAQSTAFEELTATRSREQQEHAVSAQESRVRGETLAAAMKALEERHRHSVESLAARDAELTESRSARTALEETLRTAHSSDSARAARAAELEALSNNLRQALQTQTEATDRANASLDSRVRELADERARTGALETQLQATLQQAAEQQAAAQSTETALNARLAQLVADHDRLANFERAATSQSERLANLQVELARAQALAEQSEASRHVLESELERVRIELQREVKRASALDGTQRKLALELERTRGALDERELQLRRLERYATSSAQVLGRIKAGIERGGNITVSETLESSDERATLVPLDDSDAPPLTLGPLTTIGRAPESNLCLKDSSVSRRHAVVTIGSKGAFIEDIHSVNGVTVNHQRIRHARLADGDVIELGLKRFRFMTAPERNADAG